MKLQNTTKTNAAAAPSNNAGVARKHYDNIDGIRAYSAIGIVMMHVAANLGFGTGVEPLDKFIGFFTNFVFIFMIVSAFSMCCGYYQRISESKISISEFYSRRYAKILPFFALLVIVDVIVSPSIGALYEGFANLTLCFSLLPNPNISIIGVGWTLGIIFLFYLLFPFFCFLLKSKKSAWLSFVVSIVFNIACTNYFFNTNHVVEGFSARTNFVFCAMFFISGGLIFLYRYEIEKFVKKTRWIFLLICAVFTAAYFICPMLPELFGGENITNILMLIIFSLWLMYAIGAKSFILSNRFTKFISSISMESYLCHMLIFRVFEKLKITALFGSSWWSYLIIVLLTVSASVAFAVCAKLALKKFTVLLNGLKHKTNNKAEL